MSRVGELRIATYNVHKCVGMDRRRSVERIARVIKEIDPDVIALQEVMSERNGHSDGHQAEALAERLGMALVAGPAIEGPSHQYGNVVLTRLEVAGHENHDISCDRREPRACMRVDFELAKGTLHFYNTHLGTSYAERCSQARQLLESGILEAAHPAHPQILVGDFNDWFIGRPTRTIRDRFHDVTSMLRPTYPGVVPLLRLDRIYVNQHVRCRHVAAHTSPLALVASDHLPIIATVETAAV